jgi:hypothetical protein
MGPQKRGESKKREGKRENKAVRCIKEGMPAP